MVSSGVVVGDSGASFEPEPRIELVFEAEYMMAPRVGTHGDRYGAPAGSTVVQPGLLDKVDPVELETFVEDMVGDQDASAEEDFGLLPTAAMGTESGGKPGGETEYRTGGDSVGESGGEFGDTPEGKAEEVLSPVDSGLEAVEMSLSLEPKPAFVPERHGLAAGLATEHGGDTEAWAVPDVGLWVGLDAGL